MDGSGETSIPSHKGRGWIPGEKHMAEEGREGWGAIFLQLNWFYHHLLELETVNKSQVVTFQIK